MVKIMVMNYDNKQGDKFSSYVCLTPTHKILIMNQIENKWIEIEAARVKVDIVDACTWNLKSQSKCKVIAVELFATTNVYCNIPF